MKRYLTLGMLLLFSCLMISCTTYRSSVINANLASETWRNAINRNTVKWHRGADQWFLRGEPNETEKFNRLAPYAKNMSVVKVKVPNFTKIRVEGNFQIQLFGTSQHNSVYLLGPNDAVGAAIIKASGDMLCIEQRPDAPGNTDQVIIRIGVRELTQLIQLGCSKIEGVWLNSRYLDIITAPMSGSRIYLSGNLRLRHISHAGQGGLYVFGANTPDMEIKSSGNGHINICGSVGIQSIIHHGNDHINIVGAKSPRLDIIADGTGKIAISGQVNLRELVAKDNVQVYIDGVTSENIHVFLKNHACVGLAGLTNELNIQAYDESVFFGRYLCSYITYAKAFDAAHMNVNGARALGMATQEGSIYYFGASSHLMPFTRSYGIVLPLFDDGRSCHIYNRTYQMQERSILIKKRIKKKTQQFRGAG